MGFKRLEGVSEQANIALIDNSRGSSPTLAVISVCGIIGGVIYSGIGVTGNVISGLGTGTTSVIGAGLFLIGIVSGFFWIKDRK